MAVAELLFKNKSFLCCLGFLCCGEAIGMDIQMEKSLVTILLPFS